MSEKELKTFINFDKKLGGLYIGETIYGWEIDIRILWLTFSLGIVKGI